MKNDLSKHYGTLDAKERINLSLAAIVRGDEEEVTRLCKSCEQLTYTKPDVNYSGKMERLILIGFWYQIRYSWFALEALQKMTLKDIWKSKIEGYRQCFQDIIETNLLQDDNLTEDHPILSKVEKYCSNYRKEMLKAEKDLSVIVSKLAAIYNALKLFCKKTGVNFENMIAWATYLGEDFSEKPEDPPSDMEVDKEVLEKVLSEFMRLWENT